MLGNIAQSSEVVADVGGTSGNGQVQDSCSKSDADDGESDEYDDCEVLPKPANPVIRTEESKLRKARLTAANLAYHQRKLQGIRKRLVTSRAIVEFANTSLSMLNSFTDALTTGDTEDELVECRAGNAKRPREMEAPDEPSSDNADAEGYSDDELAARAGQPAQRR